MSLSLEKLLLLDAVLQNLVVEAKIVIDNIPPSITSSASSNRLRIDYAKTRNKFEKHVTSAVDLLDAAKISRREFNRRFYGFLNYYYTAAYELGKEITGGTSKLDKYDVDWLENEVKDEYSYSIKFANDILLKTGSMDYAKRAMLYVNAIDGVFFRGMTAGLEDGTLVDWNCDPNVENCDDCLALQGNSPYVVNDLPTYPRAGKCQCLTNCKCFLSLRKEE